jgi:hypothetical protein
VIVADVPGRKRALSGFLPPHETRVARGVSRVMNGSPAATRDSSDGLPQRLWPAGGDINRALLRQEQLAATRLSTTHASRGC